MDGVAHDLRTFVDSNLGRRMDQLPDHPHGGRYVLYGDSAYSVKRTRRYISTACSIRAPTTGAQRRYSHELNRMRVTVERMFGINYGCWELLRKRTAMMTGQSSVGMWFSVSILLTNIRTCIRRGNNVSMYFNCPPPTLDEYLSAPQPEESRYARRMRRAAAVAGRVGV